MYLLENVFYNTYYTLYAILCKKKKKLKKAFSFVIVYLGDNMKKIYDTNKINEHIKREAHTNESDIEKLRPGNFLPDLIKPQLLIFHLEPSNGTEDIILLGSIALRQEHFVLLVRKVLEESFFQ